MTISTINPATEAMLKTFEPLTDQALSNQLDQGYQAQLQWSQTSFEQRQAFLMALSSHLKEHITIYATSISTEMGKPIKQSQQEIEKCALICEYYAENMVDFLSPQKTNINNPNYYQLCPSGIIFAIMPWNFPFWQVFRAAIPNLALGNGFMLSHAPNVLGSAKFIEAMMIESGLPKGLMQSLIINHDQAANIIKHPYISGITLTGSNQTGKIIAAHAGEALKKVVLELGGNDPYLILDDADIDLAADSLVHGRFMNAGQVCVSPKRIIATKTIFTQLENKVHQLVANYQTGDPLNEDCMMGPMARVDLRDQLHQQIEESIQLGAKCLLGGQFEDKLGFYYKPSLLSQVQPGMPAFNDELFGPVIALISANDEQDAIKLANQSAYGLGGGVFSQDIQKAEYIISQKLHIGLGKVNGLVRSDPKLPFGGVKGSGFGRECGKHGMQEFANIKTIIL